MSETPSTSGEFLLEKGVLAGRRYGYEASVCENPVCHCERVTLKFSMGMHERRSGPPTSVSLDMDLERRQIANIKALAADPNARALANAVAAEIGDEEWDRLRRRYWVLKQYWTEHSDLEQVDISFPPDVLDGTLVSYYHLFRFARRVEFTHAQETWVFDDQYCLNPRCPCQQAALTFICVSKAPERHPIQPTRALYYDYKDGKISQVETEVDAQYSLPELLETLKKARGDLDSLLANRHVLLKHLCSRDSQRKKTEAKQARQTIHTIPSPTPKIGRNDPCPCGSRKKWKRCCGAVA